MRCLLILSILLFAFAGNAQEVELRLSKLPLRNGHISKQLKPSCRFSCPSDGVFIDSTNDSCFATTSGVVVSTFDLGGEFAVLIKSKSEQFFTYSGFSKLSVQKNDIIQTGSFIGQLKGGDEPTYELLYIITNKKGHYYPRSYHLEYLRHHDIAVDCNNAQVL